jgi:hypothetical protein
MGAGVGAGIAKYDDTIQSMDKKRLDAFEGCMLGLAIGDALGFPAERAVG